ncbi:hypothetical protein [Methylocaldum sp. RMAD-M]|jgi:hypothetical protein|uniref:hypothetical protein n=1 Tax=Methylocaldum sp. RMAD-M TaxID=2806557 RepID=UPI001AE24F40|nr:hypothetical protein [Methylocaldum sp. RMAD-M]
MSNQTATDPFLPVGFGRVSWVPQGWEQMFAVAKKGRTASRHRGRDRRRPAPLLQQRPGIANKRP